MIRHGTKHVPTRWLSLFNAIQGFGADDCPAASWIFLSEQGDEMATDEEPTIQELYLYFTHFFMSSIQDTVLKLENRLRVS